MEIIGDLKPKRAPIKSMFRDRTYGKRVFTVVTDFPPEKKPRVKIEGERKVDEEENVTVKTEGVVKVVGKNNVRVKDEGDKVQAEPSRIGGKKVEIIDLTNDDEIVIIDLTEEVRERVFIDLTEED